MEFSNVLDYRSSTRRLRADQSAGPRDPAMPRPANILLLQGPVGGFFGELEKYLSGLGHHVQSVSFHFADRFFGPRGAISYRGGIKAWPEWLAAFVERHQVDVVLLFGSERPAHIAARKVAEKAGIDVLSLEEGYIRPGFITLERNGNNASSPLAGRLPPAGVKIDDVGNGEDYRSFRSMAAKGAAYYGLRCLTAVGREKELFHRRFTLHREVFYWLRNLKRRYAGESRNYRIVERLLEHHDGRFFIVPLQVAADANLQGAAMGWNSLRLIRECLTSFASCAAETTRLVFKIHPMERGHCSYDELIASLAAELGVADRVEVIDTGSMGLLARHAAGMITINSTSGLSAIYHGIPLLVVGRALYANPGLAVCAMGQPDFDSFWLCSHVAPKKERMAYIDWIKQEALVPGDYYNPAGVARACEGVSLRIAELMMQKQELGSPSAAQRVLAL